jgi:hypothetical protein
MVCQHLPFVFFENESIDARRPETAEMPRTMPQKNLSESIVMTVVKNTLRRNDPKKVNHLEFPVVEG